MRVGARGHLDQMQSQGLSRFGTDADVAWINEATSVGLGIESAIPPAFDAYATITLPEPEMDDRRKNAGSVLRHLRAHSGDQQWWLGYLDTGGPPVMFPAAPQVTLCSNWSYAFVLAEPGEALRWRFGLDSGPRPGPDIAFPVDRSWLMSWLWDDEWRCLARNRPVVHRSRPGSAWTRGTRATVLIYGFRSMGCLCFRSAVGDLRRYLVFVQNLGQEGRRF
jgi:hypothetical protein